MIVLFLLLVIAAMALGILGVVVHGLLYLLFTGVGVLIIAFLLGALWMRRRTPQETSRSVRAPAASHAIAARPLAWQPHVYPLLDVEVRRPRLALAGATDGRHVRGREPRWEHSRKRLPGSDGRQGA